MHRLAIALLLLVMGATASVQQAWGENTQYATIIIDSSTIQPVGTGLIPDSTNVNFVLFAESGNRMPGTSSRPYTNGWTDPNGETRLSRFGQPMQDLPAGCLLGTYNGNLSASFFLPNQADWTTQIAEVGDELKLGLNMTDADLALLEGSVVIHVAMIPGDLAESDVFVISSTTTLPLATGITALEGDEFMLLAKGALRVPGAGGAPYSNDVFGPEGHQRLFAAGQLQANAPFGCALGSFDPGGTMVQGFRIANGGTFPAEISDFGDELWLDINMSAADRANAQGFFHVTVIRIPNPATAVEIPGEVGPVNKLLGSAPNPLTRDATIAYATAQSGRVLLRIYDAAGRSVRTLVDEIRPAGEQQVLWDGRDENGAAVASGAYFYQLSAGDHSETRKIVVVK